MGQSQCWKLEVDGGRLGYQSDGGNEGKTDEGKEEGIDDEEKVEELAGESSCGVLDRVALKALRDNLASDVADLLGMELEDAMVCLRLLHYDSDALTETYFDDPLKLRQELGVSEGDGGPDGDLPLCGICFCDVAAAQVLPCRGHGYCPDCWKSYLSIAIQEGKGCLDLRCPDPKCSERVRPALVKRFCTPDLVERYERFSLDAFVEDSTSRKWCPRPGCGLACERAGSGRKSVECRCGMEWCFECSNDEHQPVSCSVVKKWNEKTVDTGNDYKWILANTKPCPKCNVPIEKNLGCMHMTCHKPSGGCGHEFCWICLGNWRGHQECNAISKTEGVDVTKARSDIQKYGHCWERFVAQEAAQKMTATSLQTRACLIVDVFTADNAFTVMDMEFLPKAVTQIYKCRRFLKWTYAFAYLLDTTQEKKQLFEFHQAQMQGTLERLSGIVENTNWEYYGSGEAISNREFYDKRAATISLTSVVRNFFDSLRTWLEETFPDG